jgi:adenylosuccinate lyase
VIDTALALVTRNAMNLIEADIRKAVAALLALARRHAADDGAGPHADAAGLGHQLRLQVRGLGRAAGAQLAALAGRGPTTRSACSWAGPSARSRK